MKNYSSGQIRNICLVGPQGAGKTSLIESMFFCLGKITRKGDIASGNTISDFTEEEIERKISMHLSVSHFEHNDLKINIIDTPGYSDFWGDAASGLWVVENAFFVIPADGGLDINAEGFWAELTSQKKPTAIVVSKLDRENIDFEKIYLQLIEKIGQQVAPLYIPVRTGAGMDSICDLMNMKLLKGKETADLTAETKKYAEPFREKLIEAVASSDDALMERYLNGDEIKTEELVKFVKKAFSERNIFPLLSTSSNKMAGIESLIKFIAEETQSPVADENSPFSGVVFKTSSEPGMGHLNFLKICSGKITSGKDVMNFTRNKPERIGQIATCVGKKRTENTIAMAGDIVTLAKLKETKTNDIIAENKHKPDIAPIPFPEPLYERAIFSKNKGDEEKIGQALSNVLLEHPTVKQFYRTETREMVLAGLGNLQLEVITKKAKSAYHVDMELNKPRIPYKETALGSSHVQGKYKRQSGGRGQYGDCWLKIEHKPIGSGYEFIDKIVGGAIPKNYIPSIEKGVKEAMEQGVIAGYPVVDIKVTVDDGSFHEVDSSDMAFKIAGAMALRKGVLEARPCLLEPILNVEVMVPEEFMGSIMGDLNSRRGKVSGMDRVSGKQLVKAQVPWGEMFEYLIDLKSLTRGSGKFKYSFSHYEIAPPQVTHPLIDTFNKSKAKEDE